MAKPNKRASRLKLGLLTAVAAMGVSAVAASGANAQVQAQFDNAFLKTGAFPNPGLDILNPDPVGPPIVPNAQVNATITGAPGANGTPVTIPDSGTPATDGFKFPPFSGTVLGGAVGVSVSLQQIENITGFVNTDTGAVATNEADFEATLVLDFTPMDTGDPTDTCVISPIPMAFNTTQPFPSPYAGDPFTFVAADIATDALDDGAMVATWPTLPAANHTSGPGDCGTVGALTGGRGGLWIADNIATPVLNAAPPVDSGPPPVTNPPAKKKCKKGQKLKKGKCVKKKKKKKKKK
ncbi:MAG: hypothetical protein ACXWYV_09320 [Solirubrobacterales bacterium]